MAPRTSWRDRRRYWWAAILTALSSALLFQLVRAYIPLAFELGEDIGGSAGYLTAGAVAIAVFASPALGGIGGRAGRGRVALVAAVVLLAAARVAVQLVHPIPIWLGVVAVVTGLVVMPTIVSVARRAEGDAALLTGVFLGLALDTAIRGGFLTWDVAWQEGPTAIGVAIVLGVLAIVAAVALPIEGASLEPPALRLALFGPFLALQLLFLQNPAAVASQSELSLPIAVAIVLGGDALALAIGSLRLRIGATSAGFLMVLAAAGGYFLTEVTGTTASIVFAVEQTLLILLLLRALIAEPLRPERLGRLAGACALGSVAFVAVVFAYQVHNEVRLPFPNAVVLAAAAAIVGIGALPRRGTIAGWVPRGAVLIPVALLAVPAVVWAAEPALQRVPGQGGAVRIVSYNIHGGVNADGQVDPETTAQVIEAQDPDVVLLQEVARGWPIFGGLDAAEWLSRRLEMPYRYVPAADEQFGNAVLSRLPIRATAGGELPLGEGPQQRSYLTVVVDAGGGQELMVIDTHLQESSGDPETRTRQITTLLDAWSGREPAVIAGDMNLQPDEDDVQLFLEAGLVSVQDEVGDPCEPTAFEPKPEKPCDRPDWIFATPDLALSDFVIVASPASDHLPVVVTVTI
jgi:endonuclease/exonuclease/phosphatase family metal-dependent hydrolase